MRTPHPVLLEAGEAVRQSGLVHRVWQPSADGPHPTVVMLHGRSGNQDVAWIFGRALPRAWLTIAPRAILADPRGGYSWAYRPDGGLPHLDDLEAAVEALDEFVQALPRLYGADLGRTYLLGFSQGAALAYAYAMRRRPFVRGIAGLVGLMPQGVEESPALANLRDLPVWMAVGRRDTTVPLSESERCAALLIRAAARLDYRVYDTGHKLNAAGMADLALWWRLQAEREVATADS